MSKFPNYCPRCRWRGAPRKCFNCEMREGMPNEFATSNPQDGSVHINEPLPKPPLGLAPRWLADSQRVADILEAMHRYNEVGKPVPREWLAELNEKLRVENAPEEKTKR